MQKAHPTTSPLVSTYFGDMPIPMAIKLIIDVSHP